jgi:hypothetical protein
MTSHLLTMKSLVLISALVIPSWLVAQNKSGATDPSLPETVKQLQEQMNELREVVTELRQESQRYRSETEALRIELKAALDNKKGLSQADSIQVTTIEANDSRDIAPTQDRSQSDESNRLAKMEEDLGLLSQKVNDQYQTKVESTSKYRVRLSGIALFNTFANHGNFASADTADLVGSPDLVGRSNSFGGSLRQSQIGLEVFGPDLAGAHTRGEVQFDFAGGFPDAPNGVTLGIMRLRTGTIHLDWPRTSIVAGQDALFFSPLSPTSFATLAEPAMSYSGNLWTWTPQVRVEHKIPVSENSNFLIQAGILDPLSGESPYSYATYNRLPQAGEYSRKPAYAARAAWSGILMGQQATLGAGGYFSSQDWGFQRNVKAWSGMVDWSIPFGNEFAWSGEIYRGEGLGGLGGGTYRSVLFKGPPTSATSEANGLNTVGGWSQIKFKPQIKWEFDVAVGEDNPFANEVRTYPYNVSSRYAQIVRNQSGLVNVIYRPRSSLLFSAEYRRVQTYRLDTEKQSADQVNLAMGILF